MRRAWWLLWGALAGCQSDALFVVRRDDAVPKEFGAFVDGVRTSTPPVGPVDDEIHVANPSAIGVAIPNFEAPLPHGNAIVFGGDIAPELIDVPWTPQFEGFMARPLAPIELPLTIVLTDLPAFDCSDPEADPSLCDCQHGDPLRLNVSRSDEGKADLLCHMMRDQVDSLAALLVAQRTGLRLGPLQVVDARALAPPASTPFGCGPVMAAPYLAMLDKAATGWDACPQSSPRLTVVATMHGLRIGNNIVVGLHCPGFGAGVPEPFGPAACAIDPAVWPRRRRLIGVDVMGGAFVLAHEVGHALGLEHLSETQEQLNGLSGNVMRRFVPAASADLTEAQTFRAHYHPRSAVRRDLGARPLSEARSCPTVSDASPACPPIERSIWSTGFVP